MVVMAIPETDKRWRHALACQQQDPRFPVGAPSSGSLALAWQGLAALKPEVGRMALIMPIAVLAATGGYYHAVQDIALTYLTAIIIDQ